MSFQEQIVFVYVQDLEPADRFYGGVLGLDLVLDQGGCLIYQVAGSAYLGICDRPERAGIEGSLVTLVTGDVDEWFERLVNAGAEIIRPPQHSAEYQIYNFFARDPDGNRLEIQRFDDESWKVAEA